MDKSRDLPPWLTIFTALTPSVIACAGVIAAAIFAFSASHESVKAQYVSLAISILRAPKDEVAKKQGAAEPDLREWAVRVLQANTDIKMPRSLSDKLRDGSFFLPDFMDSYSIAPQTGMPDFQRYRNIDPKSLVRPKQDEDFK
jgi:hypothetical protein